MEVRNFCFDCGHVSRPVNDGAGEVRFCMNKKSGRYLEEVDESPDEGCDSHLPATANLQSNGKDNCELCDILQRQQEHGERWFDSSFYIQVRVVRGRSIETIKPRFCPKCGKAVGGEQG